MIVQCPACRALVDIGGFLLDAEGERAGVVCRDCGETSWLPLSEAADVAARAPATRAPASTPARSTTAPPEAPASSSIDAEAVRALLVEREASGAPDGEAQLDLAAGFEALLSTWDDEKAHEALVKRAGLQGELAFLGQRYRAVLEQHPDDARAKQAQERILGQAMARMSTLPGDGPPVAASNAAKVLVAIVSFGLFGVAIWFLVRSAFPAGVP